MKILFISSKAILFFLVVAAAYNLLFSIVTIYNIEWYSLHFENDGLGLFMGSFFWLQLMFLLRFTGVRYMLLVSGGCGLVVMAIKLHTPLDATVMSALGQIGNWPSVEDVRILCLFCTILFVEGLLFKYAVKFLNFIVVRPMKSLLSSQQKL